MSSWNLDSLPETALLFRTDSKLSRAPHNFLIVHKTQTDSTRSDLVFQQMLSDRVWKMPYFFYQLSFSHRRHIQFPSEEYSRQVCISLLHIWSLILGKYLPPFREYGVWSLVVLKMRLLGLGVSSTLYDHCREVYSQVIFVKTNCRKCIKRFNF